MYKKILSLAFCISLSASPVLAMDMSHGGTMKMSGTNRTTIHQEGKFIRSAVVEGYEFRYYLIDMKAKMAKIAKINKEMAAMDMGKMKSHHLMLYILDKNKRKVSEGRVGYQLVDADGKKQKTMTMAMSGGYGADVDMRPGTYKIMAKALLKDTKLMDSFEFTLK